MLLFGSNSQLNFMLRIFPNIFQFKYSHRLLNWNNYRRFIKILAKGLYEPLYERYIQNEILIKIPKTPFMLFSRITNVSSLGALLPAPQCCFQKPLEHVQLSARKNHFQRFSTQFSIIKIISA